MTAQPGDEFRAACAPFLAKGMSVHVDFEAEDPMVVLTVTSRDGSDRRFVAGDVVMSLEVLRRMMRIPPAPTAPMIEGAANDAH